MNKLYTSHKECELEAVRYAKNNKLEFLSFVLSRQSIDSIVDLYKTSDRLVICLEGLNKSNVCDSLLIPLEENKKDIHLFASTSTLDVKPTLVSRFQEVVTSKEENTAVNFLLTGKATKEEYSNLKFWLDLAEALAVTHDIVRLRKVNNIIKDIQLTTNNTLWGYYYELIKP
jgi:hypothetical protein